MKSIFVLALLFNISWIAPAFAKDCSVGVFKTYIPKDFPDQDVCDEHGLPAEFANGDEALIKKLNTLGYSAHEYDQCAKGHSDPASYSLITQMGDCTQTGNLVSCNMWVALIEEKSNKTVFENTIFVKDDASNTSYYFLQAMKALPRCSSL
jgi:hypothetical protein